VSGVAHKISKARKQNIFDFIFISLEKMKNALEKRRLKIIPLTFHQGDYLGV
jgi:hypothetical protein